MSIYQGKTSLCLARNKPQWWIDYLQKLRDLREANKDRENFKVFYELPRP